MKAMGAASMLSEVTCLSSSPAGNSLLRALLCLPGLKPGEAGGGGRCVLNKHLRSGLPPSLL